ncbi:hypothetical protein RhiJN_13545 [Ceratobasidium sp. AG-Ba]|nr:hypothetical protein RhiJN_13545 [Ceratobasidium sp. AG-Ba]QRW14103.1 hypothetical protein RhiLY_13102 [Ceratobasidium sp. AG-Ba]
MLLFVIAPLMFLSAAVRNTLISHFGHDDESGFCEVATWYFSGSIVMETFKIVYRYVETDLAEYKAEPQLAPWPYDYWNTPRQERVSLWSLVAPIHTPKTGAWTDFSPYETLSLDGFVPTRASSAVLPVHAFDAGPSTGLSSMVYAPRPTLPRRWSSMVVDGFEPVEDVAPTPLDLAASTPLSPDAWAIIGPSPTPSPSVTPAHDVIVSMSVSDYMAPSLLLSSAGSESTVPTPVPTIAAASPSLARPANHKEPTDLAHPENPRSSWLGVFRSCQHSWLFNLAVSVTVQVVVTVYLTRYRSQKGEVLNNDLVDDTYKALSGPTVAELAEVRHLLIQLEDIPYILDDHGLSPQQLRAYIEMAVAARDAPVQETGHGVSESRTDQETSRMKEVPPLHEVEPPAKVYRSVATSPMVPLAAHSRTGLDSYSEVSTSKWSDEPSGSSMSSVQQAALVRSAEDVFQGGRRQDSASDDSTDASGQYHRHWTPAQSSWTGSSFSDEIRGNAKRTEVNASPLAHKSRVTALMLDIPRRPSRIQLRSPGSSMRASSSVEESGSTELEPDTTSSPAPVRRGPLAGVGYSPVPARPSAPEPDTTIETENSVTVRKREWLDKWHREREARGQH